MTTPRHLLCIPVVALALAVVGCSDSGSSTASTGVTVDVSSSSVSATSTDSATSMAAPTTAAGATSVPSPSDSADIPVAPTAPPDSADIPIAPVDTSDVPVIITVTVGVDSAPTRIETVPRDALVTLSITNPKAADEFHLHGYDLGEGKEMAAGATETLTFTADTAGEFELESHSTGAVLLTLRVV